MGLNSARASTLAAKTAGSKPIFPAISACALASCGKNSCNGGSKSRMVTGRPSIASKIPIKSDFWYGRSLTKAASRSPVLSAKIISCMYWIRSFSGPKNMCSVRQSPIPSAPNSRATFASCGVSAFVRTRRSRYLSAQDIKIPKFPVISGSTRSVWPRITSPVEPFRVSQSPSRRTFPLRVKVFSLLLITASPHPATQHLPIPRATTAAWEVMPPREVKIPTAACIPPISSGLVS